MVIRVVTDSDTRVSPGGIGWVVRLPPQAAGARQRYLQTSRTTYGSGWSHAPHPDGDASATEPYVSSIRTTSCHVLGHILHSRTLDTGKGEPIHYSGSRRGAHRTTHTQFCPLTHEQRLRLRPPTTQTVGSSAAVVFPHAPRLGFSSFGTRLQQHAQSAPRGSGTMVSSHLSPPEQRTGFSTHTRHHRASSVTRST